MKIFTGETQQLGSFSWLWVLLSQKQSQFCADDASFQTLHEVTGADSQVEKQLGLPQPQLE